MLLSDEESPPDALDRSLGLGDAVGIGLGAVMGAGIFVVIGTAAGLAGPGFLIGLIIAGIAASLNGLSAAQLAATFPQSGGTYEYAYRLIHPAAGFAAAWMFLVSKIAAAGVVALGFGHYLHSFLPTLSPPTWAALALLILTAANLAGIKKAAIVNLFIVFLTLLALVAFVIAAWPHLHARNLSPLAPHGWGSIAESSALLFFAFTGYARIATLAEEIKNPQKNIPLAIILTLALSLVIYLLVGFVAVGSYGAEQLAQSTTPLLSAAQTFSANPNLPPLLTLGAISALLGVLLSQILGISRMILALARRGDLPKSLEKISRRQIPTRAILLTSFLILATILVGKLTFVISAAAFTILIYYALTNLSALFLTSKDRLYPKSLAWIGLLVCLAMACSLQPTTIATGLTLLLAGYATRLLIRKTTP